MATFFTLLRWSSRACHVPFVQQGHATTQGLLSTPVFAVKWVTVSMCFRYRGEVSQKLTTEVDAAPPEWFYAQAAKVWPEGGQPLNQLAVMALHKRKHLKSAYYYAR